MLVRLIGNKKGKNVAFLGHGDNVMLHKRDDIVKINEEKTTKEEREKREKILTSKTFRNTQINKDPRRAKDRQAYLDLTFFSFSSMTLQDVDPKPRTAPKGVPEAGDMAGAGRKDGKLSPKLSQALAQINEEADPVKLSAWLDQEQALDNPRDRVVEVLTAKIDGGEGAGSGSSAGSGAGTGSGTIEGEVDLSVLNAKDALEAIAGVEDKEVLAKLLAAEKDGKARQGVMDALKKALK